MHKKLIKYFFKKNHIDHTKKELVDVKKKCYNFIQKQNQNYLVMTFLNELGSRI
jgi:hypothetical protein